MCMGFGYIIFYWLYGLIKMVTNGPLYIRILLLYGFLLIWLNFEGQNHGPYRVVNHRSCEWHIPLLQHQITKCHHSVLTTVPIKALKAD